MVNRTTFIILLILLAGAAFRLITSSNGNFLFNMDNARDMVGVRGMVVLHKFRLIGPTTAIEGLSNGPAWYYLLAIPFLISGGDPYASIIMEIIFWAAGGFFLLKLVKAWSIWLIFPIGAIWVSSNYILLASAYAFNPNPIILLTPLLIYLLVKYLENEKAIYGISAWFLGGLFFNFEMNFGIFIPLIILISIIAVKKLFLLKQKSFWLGLGFFILTLLPQIIFDLKHEFLMSRAIMRHLSENVGGNFNFLESFRSISLSFFDTFLATLMNNRLLTLIILILAIPALLKKGKDQVILVSLIFIVVPFLGYLILPVTVNPWHLGAEMAALLVLIAYLLKELIKGNNFKKIIAISLSGTFIIFAFGNIFQSVDNYMNKPNIDPSLLKNEIAAIDYVYRKARGQNFKVYTYLPSIYDYPYQYLFWWYGQKNYGYLPIDYAYAPNKPEYISNKIAFSATEDQIKKRTNSGLVFLIKEPNQNYTRFGWEGDFIKLKSISKEMIGPLEIEIMKE
ncbi:MAG: hypothetical protein Q7R77_02860 [Candidatus Daviesbacteria bacterium]|nr:hypothetical protein [Candidatus Daviesbacteria bacterium]